MAGSPCTIEIMRKVVGKMNIPDITIRYGMTETKPVSFKSGLNDPLERSVSIVGQIHPHLEVKIIDADGNIVPRGTRGELCTKGYSVMRGYWNDDEQTTKAIDSESWMHTGDIAIIDNAGYYQIVGRVKDLVIRGGESYPRVKLKNIYIATKAFKRCRFLACQTRFTAKSFAPGLNCAKEKLQPRHRYMNFAVGKPHIKKFPVT